MPETNCDARPPPPSEREMRDIDEALAEPTEREFATAAEAIRWLRSDG